MNNYTIKFTAEFETEIQADDLEAAEHHAKHVVARFTGGRLLSVVVSEETPENDPAAAAAEVG